MAKQRNNIARMNYEQRVEISRMLFDGASYDDIRDAFPAAKIHNSSILAWAHGREHQEYCAARKGFDERSRRARLAAAIQNDGRGPQSLADVAEYELLQEIVGLTDQAVDPESANQLSSAIARLKKVQIADRIQKLERAIAAEREAYRAQVAAMREQITEMQAGRAVDPAAVADRLNQILGVTIASEVE